MRPSLSIRYYRIRINGSQNHLAKAIGVSQSYISDIEKGKKLPSLEILYRIASELNVCPRLLLSCNIECKNCTCNKEGL